MNTEIIETNNNQPERPFLEEKKIVSEEELEIHLEKWNEQGVEDDPEGVIDEILRAQLDDEYDSNWTEKVKTNSEETEKIIDKILEIFGWNDIQITKERLRQLLKIEKEEIEVQKPKEEVDVKYNQEHLQESGYKEGDIKDWT